jgi:hypothetical protein
MVLTMVYNTRNYWVLDFLHRPVFWELENTTFRKLHLFPSSGVGEYTYSVASFRQS